MSKKSWLFGLVKRESEVIDAYLEDEKIIIHAHDVTKSMGKEMHMDIILRGKLLPCKTKIQIDEMRCVNIIPCPPNFRELNQWQKINSEITSKDEDFKVIMKKLGLTQG